MKLFLVITLILFFFSSCQKEFNAPFKEVAAPQIVPEIASIVITYGSVGDYDSTVYRYANDKTREVHFSFSGDSTVRTYYYDADTKLIKIEDDKAIFYTNNNVAKNIRFFYDNYGNLKETVTGFENVPGIKAYYSIFNSGENKQVVVYDTAYKSSSYDLDWANRIIYTTLGSDNSILYDSCIYINYHSGLIKTIVSGYVYDAGKNVTAINNSVYQQSELSEWGIITIKRDKPAPVYESLRKKLYHNLADWYQISSAMQDDAYKFFLLPNGMYKSYEYKGSSLTGTEDIIRNTFYDNNYSNDVLVSSHVNYVMSGQGSTHYIYDIRYYYR